MELVVMIAANGDIRHLNKDVLNDMRFGEITHIERSSYVEVFHDLPSAVQRILVSRYGSLNSAQHIRRFPAHALYWWVWIPTIMSVSGPYCTREQALSHEVTILQNIGLPVRERAD